MKLLIYLAGVSLGLKLMFIVFGLVILGLYTGLPAYAVIMELTDPKTGKKCKWAYLYSLMTGVGILLIVLAALTPSAKSLYLLASLASV
jgi:hypothetical protein